MVYLLRGDKYRTNLISTDVLFQSLHRYQSHNLNPLIYDANLVPKSLETPVIQHLYWAIS